MENISQTAFLITNIAKHGSDLRSAIKDGMPTAASKALDSLLATVDLLRGLFPAAPLSLEAGDQAYFLGTVVKPDHPLGGHFKVQFEPDQYSDVWLRDGHPAKA